jgi:hypothetical protein
LSLVAAVEKIHLEMVEEAADMWLQLLKEAVEEILQLQH